MSKRSLGLLVLVLSTFSIRTALANATYSGTFIVGPAIVGDPTGAQATKLIDDDDTTDRAVNLSFGLGCDGEFEFVSATGATCTATGCTDFQLPGNLTVKYIASTRTQQDCTIEAVRSSGGQAYGTFVVSGTGIGPHLEPPAVVSIGDVRVAGTTTGMANLVLHNDGERDMTVTSVTSNNAAFTVGTVPPMITAGMSVNVPITFDPTIEGLQSSSLTIVTDGTPQPTQNVNATGRGTNAVIGVANASFGGTNIVPVGTSVGTTMTISNTAASNAGVLRITGGSISPSAGSWITFGAAAGCAGGTTSCTYSTLTTSTSTTVPITCSPPSNATGSQTATITFTSDSDAGGDNTGSVTCIAGRADALPVPAMVMFTDRIINTISPTTNVVITNMGNVPLTYSLTITNTGSQFAITPACTTGCTLNPGISSQPIVVDFRPTSVGAKSANIRITSNDPDGPIDIPISGNGIAPHLSVNLTSPQSFGTVEVGSSGTAKMLTITSDGTSPVTISSVGLTSANPNWSITGSLGTQPVAINDTRTFMINCVPTTHGDLGATLRISSNSTPTNGTIDIELDCTGNQGIVHLDDTDHDFGGVIVGQMADRTFTITNTGNVPVTNVTVTPGGTGTGYTILASPFPIATLAPNTPVMFTVRFMPAAGTDGGDRTFALSGMWGTAKTANALLTVHGDGLIEGYDATPATVTFNQRFDAITTQKVCITNTGDATVNITGMMLNHAVGTQNTEIRILNLVRRACGSTGAGTNIAFPLTGNIQLLKNQEVEAIVQFDPNDRTGMMSATITITSDLTTNPSRMVTINGTSTAAEVTNNPGLVVDFGPTDLDAGPQTRDVTITNTGVATLDLTAFTRTANSVFTTSTLPSTPQNLAMGNSVTITVTYTPTVERPAGQNDSFTISHNVGGVVGLTSQTITIQGRGVDRHIDVGDAPAFPPTFRNPGSRAPSGTITITNTGDAELDITGIMVSNDDVWQLAETGPTQIAGGASKDFHVTFHPKMLGPAPQGELVFVNNDNTSTETMMARVTLDGMGLDRNVSLLGNPIDVGTTAIGLPITLEQGLVVSSMDPTNTFTIREIQIVDDDTEAFSIANSPMGESIDGASMKQYDVTFSPTEEGEFTATALLFLDEDPTQTAEVQLTGRAVFVEIGGGGGCATSSGGGAGMVLVVGALLLARRRRRSTLAMGAATAALALVMWPADARAQAAEQTFDLDLSLFDPTPSTTNTTLQVQSAAVGKNGEWVLGAMVANATNPLVISFGDTEHMSISRRTMLELGGAYAFLDRFEAGLRMPLYNQTGDGAVVGVASPSGTARGDLVAHVRAQLFESAGPTTLVGGASLAVTFPTATGAQYAGVEMPSGRVLGLLTLTPAAIDQRLTLTVNAGGVVRQKSELQNIRQGSGLAFGGAASVRAATGLWLFGEIYGEVLPSSEVPSVMASAGTMTTAEWLGGVTYRPDPRVNISVGAGRGLVSGLGTPDFRAALAISVTPGREEVKVIEPVRPPVVEKDSDGDGILDGADACKDDREDMDGFQDGDGCPDTDNDADGFLDSDDKCKDEPEDKDGFGDDDGCPDFDNDSDGVLDVADKCPMAAEDKDSFADEDGCPEKDNDGDGLDDAMDKCPDQEETINGNADDDGCPDAGDSAIALTPSAVELLETIEFKGSELKPSASRVLGQVAATLKIHPEILRIKISVHVNPAGKEAKEKALTEERAMAIREWLIKAGISADRVSGAGMGGTKPLVKGKKSPINERVEIIILERQ